jgi:D-sedoheptulose 7-phosphate isomerase
MRETIVKNLAESAQIINDISSNTLLVAQIEGATRIIIEAYKRGNKLLIAGNGGSAADAQHIAGELVNEYYHSRKPLSALALTTDTTVLTSWANDKNFDYVFERQIEAHGRPGDIFLAITTSGKSKNLLCAVQRAKELGLTTISFLGKSGGYLKGLAHHEVHIPHFDTARIQEAQHVIYHTMCELIERAFVDDAKKP